MPVSTATICSYLEDMGLAHTVSSGGEMVVVPFGAIDIRIFVCEGGEGVTLQVPQVFNIADSDKREECLAWMAEHTYKHKIGHFGYDPRDGEVDVSFFFPVEDSDLSRSQFERLLLVMRNVAVRDVHELRKVAFGRESEPEDDTEVERLREILEGVDEAVGALGPASDTGGADGPPTARPEGPLDERGWLEWTTTLLLERCKDVADHQAFRRVWTDVWPVARELREMSVAAGFTYRTLAARKDAGLSDAEELALLYVLARHSIGDTRVTLREIDLLRPPEMPEIGPYDVLTALRQADLIECSDSDNFPPYRVTHKYLRALGPSLPFAYDGTDEPFGPDGVPDAPVNEPAWLELVRRAIVANTGDPDSAETLSLLRDVIWPKLIKLRDVSMAAGRHYRSAELRRRLRLKTAEELVVCFVWVRNLMGDIWVSPRDIDLVYSAGVGRAATDNLIERLASRGLVKSTDDDGLPPYTLGDAAERMYQNWGAP